jgi:hypothetical protein
MMPTIEFPCPENYNNMTSTAAGAYCNSCEKEVVDVSNYSLTELNVLLATNKNQCVSHQSDMAIPRNSRFSIRQFGLALLLTFGSSLFTIADAQVKEDLTTISNDLLTEGKLQTGGFLHITCESRDGRHIYTSVTLILPNGREEKLKLNSNGTYHYELPAYVSGKDILIIAKGRNNTKRQSVTIPKELNPEEVNFVFSNKNVTRFRTMGCPNF